MSRLIAATPLGLSLDLSLGLPLGLVGRWSARSQEQARRNAMAACTVLAARRLERLEVEEFIAGHLAGRTAMAVPAVLEGVG